MDIPKDYIDALAWQAAKENPLRIVVADDQVNAFRQMYGAAAIIIPVSETRLPAADTEVKHGS
jgi:hypothetical protein